MQKYGLKIGDKVKVVSSDSPEGFINLHSDESRMNPTKINKSAWLGCEDEIVDFKFYNGKTYVVCNRVSKFGLLATEVEKVEDKPIPKPLRKAMFGRLEFTVSEDGETAECIEGVVFQSEVEKVVNYYSNYITGPTLISHTSYAYFGGDDTVIHFGCVEGTLGQAKDLLSLMR